MASQRPSPTPHRLARWLVPRGANAEAWPLLAARTLRAFADGYVALLLPAYLLALGLGTLDVGILSTATMLGSALRRSPSAPWAIASPVATAAARRRAADGRDRHRLCRPCRRSGRCWSSPSSARSIRARATSASSCRSSTRASPLRRRDMRGPPSSRATACSVRCVRRSARWPQPCPTGWCCTPVCRASPRCAACSSSTARSAWRCAGSIAGRGPLADAPAAPTTPLGPSRRIVVRLAALFSVDAFAGGLIVNSLLSLWLLERFGLTLAEAGVFFFCSGLLSAASQLAAPLVARASAFSTRWSSRTSQPTSAWSSRPARRACRCPALLFVRSALSQMDVPTRTAFVMAVVTPAERTRGGELHGGAAQPGRALSPTLSGRCSRPAWIGLPLVGAARSRSPTT